MPTDLPIACSLSASEMPRRLTEIAALGRQSLLGSETTERSALLRFRADPDTRDRLAAIVAAESECCAFLTMRLRDTPDAVVLAIEAPAGAEPVLGDLVSAFAGGLKIADRRP
jgi:hypothetical protein